MAVRIVTDSTSDIPKDIAQAEGITIVPLNVHFGDEVFKDGVDLTYDAYWAKMRDGRVMPRTSQPSPVDFLAAWRPILAAGDEVLSLHLSHDLSGTVGSALIAKEMAGPDAKVTVVDTRHVSMGMGMAAIECARRAQGGASAAELTAVASGITARAHTFFTLDNLEMLAKNGRIGRASALVGGLLGIKPILKVEDGVVHAADKVRGKSKLLPRVSELAQEKVTPGSRVKFSVLYSDDQELVKPYIAMVHEVFQVDEYWITALGPVVASHVGFGVAGLILYETR